MMFEALVKTFKPVISFGILRTERTNTKQAIANCPLSLAATGHSCFAIDQIDGKITAWRPLILAASPGQFPGAKASDVM
jgi:hypothetical protein